MTDEEFTTELLLGNSDDMREMLGWQQTRYQHLQTLSEGLLGSSLTILAVIATVYAAVGSPFPAYVFPEEAKGPDFIGLLATQVIIGFSFFQVLIIGFISTVMFGISVWKFLEIVLSRPLWPSSEYQLNVSTRTPLRPQTTSKTTVLKSEYESLIQNNQEALEIIRKRFLYAGFRFPISIGLLFLTVELYLYTTQHRVLVLSALNCVFLVPSVSGWVLRRTVKSTDELDHPVRMTLFQELVNENDKRSRARSIDLTLSEKIGWILTTICSMIVVAVFISSYAL